MNQSSGPGFSNVNNPPTVQQPTSATPQRLRFNGKYLASLTGLLRLILIVIIIQMRIVNYLVDMI